jgi:hypothetical protein
MTRDFDEFAAVREELLLRIMNFVEDSGTRLASPSQTLYLSGDAGTGKDKIKGAANISSRQGPTDHTQSEPAVRNRKPDDEKNLSKDG